MRSRKLFWYCRNQERAFTMMQASKNFEHSGPVDLERAASATQCKQIEKSPAPSLSKRIKNRAINPNHDIVGESQGG